MSKSNGKMWPYGIALSIVAVFGFCVATIVVTQKANIQESDAYMTHYQDADANANELIKSTIAFNQKYKIEYVSQSIGEAEALIQYKVTDLNSNPIDGAKIIVATSRPETSDFNQKLENPKVENGVYTFSGAKFAKGGVWNIIAKVEVGKNSRYYNIKADTRNNITYEF